MKRLKYPIAYSDIEQNLEKTVKFFASKRIHKGVFLGLSVLDGSFVCDEPERIFATLQPGEKLALVPDDSTVKHSNPTLNAVRDGTVIGSLPYADAVLPNELIRRGTEVFCYAEAKKLEIDLLHIAVSVYCEKI